MKPVIFIRDVIAGGSGIMRATHISDCLLKRGERSKWIKSDQTEKILKIKNSIVIFVKLFDKILVEKVKENNIVIYDIVDHFHWIVRPHYLAPFDGVIASNQYHIDIMRKDGHLTEQQTAHVIYHHGDPRFSQRQTLKEFNLGYIGSQNKKNKENTLHLNAIPNMSLITRQAEYFEKAHLFNCHYNVRKEGTFEYMYKPNTKIAVAAAVGANIICSRDYSAIELLDKDYPFFTDTSYEAVMATIEKAKSSYNTKLWEQGLRHMERARIKTNIERITDNYIIMLKSFS